MTKILKKIITFISGDRNKIQSAEDDMGYKAVDVARYIVNKALEKGLEKNKIYMCNNNAEAVEVIKKVSNSGDAILLKASNAMNFQEIFNKIMN